MSTRRRNHLESKAPKALAAPLNDPVNHPSHYTFGSIEVIDAIEDWKLGYHLGNAVKYIARAGHKGNTLQDLEKARWYLDREIENLRKKPQPLSQNPNKQSED